MMDYVFKNGNIEIEFGDSFYEEGKQFLMIKMDEKETQHEIESCYWLDQIKGQKLNGSTNRKPFKNTLEITIDFRLCMCLTFGSKKIATNHRKSKKLQQKGYKIVKYYTFYIRKHVIHK